MRKIVRWNRGFVVTGVALGLAALGAAGAAAATAAKAPATPAVPSASSVVAAPAVPSVPFVPPLPGTPDVASLPTDPGQVADAVRGLVAAHVPAADLTAALPVEVPAGATGIAPGDTPGTRLDGVPSLDGARDQVTQLTEGLSQTVTDLLPGVPQAPSAENPVPTMPDNPVRTLPVDPAALPGADTVRDTADTADQAAAAAREAAAQLPVTASLPEQASTALTDLG